MKLIKVTKKDATGSAKGKELIAQATAIQKSIDKLAAFLEPEDLRTLEKVLQSASKRAGNQAHYYETH